MIPLRVIVGIYWTFFAITMLAGTVMVVFFVSYQRLAWGAVSVPSSPSSPGSDDDGGRDGQATALTAFSNPGGMYAALSYTFSSVWYATALFVGAFAVYARRVTKEFSAMDKVRNYIIFIKLHRQLNFF